MRIINGRWQDDNGDPVTELNYNQLKEIGSNLKNLYGEEITYNRIELISSIKSLSPKQEQELAYVLSQEGIISKLAGY